MGVRARIPADEDPDFQSFVRPLYSRDFDFQGISDYCRISDWGFRDLSQASRLWLRFSERWHSIRHPNTRFDGRVIGYAASTFLMVVLPYGQLDSERLTRILDQFEADCITFCTRYAWDEAGFTDEPLPVFPWASKYNHLAQCGPTHPAAFEQWLNSTYNKLSWWLTYRCYERLHSLPFVVSEGPINLN